MSAARPGSMIIKAVSNLFFWTRIEGRTADDLVPARFPLLVIGRSREWIATLDAGGTIGYIDVDIYEVRFGARENLVIVP